MREKRILQNTPQLYTLSVEAARAADLASIQDSGGEPQPVHEVYDREIPGPAGPLPIRVYRPSDEPDLPVLVYLFGGGWTLGSVDTSDGICRELANAVPCMVITVGYRLAPEHKFPAAVHDCFGAARWVASHVQELGGDPSRIAIGGDSAGGNLTAAVTLLSRQEGGPGLAAQLLVYPNTDYTARTGSIADNTDPYLFNNTSVEWYWANYLASPADGTHQLASPLLADDLGGLPPALVLTAEYDPLRDQGEAYARRLQEADVETTLTRYDGMVHGFFAMSGDLADGRAALAQAASFLRERLYP